MATPVTAAPGPIAPPTAAPASTPATGAPATPAAATAKPATKPTAASVAGADGVATLVNETKALDTVVSASIAQAQLAVAELTKGGKDLPRPVADSVARLSIIGTLLDQKPSAPKQGETLPQGANPVEVVQKAESTVLAAIESIAKQTVAIGQKLDPSSAPKEALAGFDAVQTRVTSAIFAAQAAVKLVPPPAPPKSDAGATPSSAPAPVTGATPSTPATAPQATTPTPAAAPAPAQASTPAPATR